MDYADIFWLALGDADRQARRDLPEAFARVDAIKAEPGWVPFATFGDSSKWRPTANLDQYEWAWCRYCGADFVVEKARVARGRGKTCSRECRTAYQHWLTRRAA